MTFPVDSSIRQRVSAVLVTNGLHPSPTERGFSLRFASTMVAIEFARVGTQTLIELRAAVLSDVKIEVPGRERVLIEINRRNAASHIGKWVLYETTKVIAVEYDLLGDHLQEDELLTAVTSVARLADQGDDQLQQSLGTGRRAIDAEPPVTISETDGQI